MAWWWGWLLTIPQLFAYWQVGNKHRWAWLVAPSSAEGERDGKKARKPTTTKEPPVPTDSHAEIEDWIRRVMPDLHPVVKRLDELFCETMVEDLPVAAVDWPPDRREWWKRSG
jgi:hypothetical protein